MKHLYDMTEFGFSTKHSLQENIEYWARRYRREAIWHRQEKLKTTDMAEQIYHGVIACDKLGFARMLITIAKRMNNLSNG